MLREGVLEVIKMIDLAKIRTAIMEAEESEVDSDNQEGDNQPAAREGH